jgi:uncharacterized peroxidase-related enzyme
MLFLLPIKGNIMPRLDIVSHPTGKSAEILTGVKKAIGMVPNIYATMAHSPTVLDAYMQFSGTLRSGQLSPAMREQIALTVAGRNHCDYCASAHSLIGKGAGLSETETSANLRGQSQEAKAAIMLKFVGEVVDKRGHVADASLVELRQAGFGDGEIVEIVAHIALNLFTNYFNHVVDTSIDFPKVSAA